jgi:hypothetical protein
LTPPLLQRLLQKLRLLPQPANKTQRPLAKRA